MKKVKVVSKSTRIMQAIMKNGEIKKSYKNVGFFIDVVKSIFKSNQF